MCNVYMFNSIFFCWLVAHSKRTAHTASAHSKADSLRQPCFIAASFGPNRQPRYLHRRSVRMYCDVKDVQGSSYPCSKLVCACRHTWSCTQTLTHRSHSVSGATRVSNIDGMAPNDDVAAIWDKLRRGEEGETLAMVGHLPFLNRCSCARACVSCPPLPFLRSLSLDSLSCACTSDRSDAKVQIGRHGQAQMQTKLARTRARAHTGLVDTC